MTEAKTVLAKYIFLDIVGYTRDRSVEAQSDIVGILNNIVREAVASQKLNEGSVIYIPTGDGMCVALLNITEPFDVHMQIALDILSRINKHNADAPDQMRKFQVRIGMNANDDNLIEDINGKRNIAGAGVSTAQRIMDKGDGGQILVGQSIFEALSQREKYMSKFRSFHTIGKHELELHLHQYVQDNLPGLNTEVPSSFQRKAESKLSKLAAYYFAHDIKLRDFLVSKRNRFNEYAAVQLLWFLAVDSVNKSEATEIKPFRSMLDEIKKGTSEEKLDFFESLPFWVTNKFARLVEESPDLSSWAKYFENVGAMLFVNAAGRDKLKREWPDIWKELGLGESA